MYVKQYIVLSTDGDVKSCYRLDLSSSPKNWTQIADLPGLISELNYHLKNLYVLHIQ